MSPQEYKLISASTPEELNKLVNEHLSKGWMVYGCPMISSHRSGSKYSQAVVTPIKVAKMRYKKNIPILP